MENSKISHRKIWDGERKLYWLKILAVSDQVYFLLPFELFLRLTNNFFKQNKFLLQISAIKLWPILFSFPHSNFLKTDFIIFDIKIQTRTKLFPFFYSNFSKTNFLVKKVSLGKMEWKNIS